MARGRIVKALSGFYYVDTGSEVIECRARGRFRADGTSPLVGDWVQCSTEAQGKGRIDKVEQRRNWFVRPSVANVDTLVFVAANTNPVTDPFLIDRVSVIASDADCEMVVCINKTDLDSADELYRIYSEAGFTTVRTSAETGVGTEALQDKLRGKICVFTGNSGVGKSSILNCLHPSLGLRTGEVSDRLGRGKHTTRHVELFDLGGGTYIVDTPGFASFDVEMMNIIPKQELQYHFAEFAPYIGQCRFPDCAHMKEPGCTVTSAVAAGDISESRYSSYVRLYDISANYDPYK